MHCYLPPRRGKTQQLNPEFQRVFIEDCDKLFADTDTTEYRQSQVRQLTYTYTCPATVLHACHVSGLADSHSGSLVIHVVGARTAEVEEAAAWSLITAHIPNIKT